MGVCSCTVKYLLFAFNFVIVLCGIALIVIGSLALSNGKLAANMLEGHLAAPSIAIIVVGSIVFVIAFFGCCGAIQENVCMVITYGVIMLVILVVEVAIGVLAIVYHNKFDKALSEGIQDLFDKYADNNETRAAVDTIQITFKCCGVDDPDYWGGWVVSNFKRPWSCCKNPDPNSGGLHCLGDTWSEGCRPKMIQAIRSLFKQLAGISLGIACVQLIGVIFAFCLANNIRNQERKGYY